MADESTPTTPEAEPKPSNVIEAILAVMREVRGVGKNDKNTQQGFNFRGIDATVNALGPAMRKHGLVVVPDLEQMTYGEVEVGAKRTKQAHVQVQVAYRFYGPAGVEDTITVRVPGEAMDSGDKGTAKAMSVAFRIALLQTFALPTTETDPDADSYERAPDFDLAKFHYDCEQAAAGDDFEDAFAAVVRDHGGEDVLDAVMTKAPDGTPVTAMQFVNGWSEHLRGVARQRAQAAQDAARQQQAGEESQDGPQQAQQPAQQPAPAPQRQQGAPADTRPARSPQEANVRRLVLAELAKQVEVRGLNLAQVHEAIAKNAEVPTLEDVDTMRLRSRVLAARSDAIAALRTAGRAQEADAYEQAAGQQAVTTWERLTGVEGDQAERQQQQEAPAGA